MDGVPYAWGPSLCEGCIGRQKAYVFQSDLLIIDQFNELLTKIMYFNEIDETSMDAMENKRLTIKSNEKAMSYNDKHRTNNEMSMRMNKQTMNFFTHPENMSYFNEIN